MRNKHVCAFAISNPKPAMTVRFSILEPKTVPIDVSEQDKFVLHIFMKYSVRKPASILN